MKKSVEEYRKELSNIVINQSKTARDLEKTSNILGMIGVILAVLDFIATIFVYWSDLHFISLIIAIVSSVLIYIYFAIPSQIFIGLADAVKSSELAAKYSKLQIDFLLDSYESKTKKNDYNNELPTM